MPIQSSLVYDPKTKSFGIAPDFDAIIPFWLTTDPPNQVRTVAAGSQTPAMPMSYRYDGPFRGHYMFYNTDYNDLLVNMVDGRDGYAYTMRGQYVHLQTIASADPGYPAVLPEAIVLQHRSHIAVNFRNLDTVNDAALRFMLQGFAFEPSRVRTTAMRDKITGSLDRMTYIRPHFATTDEGVATVAASTTDRFFMTVDDAGYFEIHKVAAIAYQTGTVTELNAAQKNLVFVQLFDYSGRQLTNGNTPDVPFTLIAGSGERPNILPARHMLPPQAQIVVEITNNNAGFGIDVYLTFIGRRVFTPGVPSQ